MMTKRIASGLLAVALGWVSTGTAAGRQNDMPILRAAGAFFALSVADADASAKWYSEKLGLKIVLKPPPANRARAIVLEGGGLIVELVQQDDARPLKTAGVQNTVLVHGIFKAGVVVEDFDRTIATLRSRNVPLAFGPFPKTPEQRANAAIRDNDGNLIQFFGK